MIFFYFSRKSQVLKNRFFLTLRHLFLTKRENPSKDLISKSFVMLVKFHFSRGLRQTGNRPNFWVPKISFVRGSPPRIVFFGPETLDVTKVTLNNLISCFSKDILCQDRQHQNNEQTQGV